MKQYHFIGIGGVGMSALAEILLQQGMRVSGSDMKESPVTRELVRKGAQIHYPQQQGMLRGGEVVVYSTAIKENNPEWREAQEKGCALLHRSELLAELLSAKEALVVAGAHGKTTTSALLAHALVSAGRDPSYVVGGFARSLASNGGSGRGGHFVAEGDESDGSFLRTRPQGAIVTNIDYDHLDYWKSKAALERAYQDFIATVQEKRLFFYWGEDPHLSKWRPSGTAYGFSDSFPLYASVGGGGSFSIHYKGEVIRDLVLQIPGRHNILNALGVFGLTRELGVSLEAIRTSFATFSGVGRRLEYKGEVRGAVLYDDYAHHPQEIRATLTALRELMPERRRVVLFQPHRYTRLLDFMEEFALALEEENPLVITDVYAAGEEKREGATVESLLAKLPKTTHYVPREKLIPFMKEFMREGDLVVTLGAGDITHVSSELSRG